MFIMLRTVWTCFFISLLISSVDTELRIFRMVSLFLLYCLVVLCNNIFLFLQPLLFIFNHIKISEDLSKIGILLLLTVLLLLLTDWFSRWKILNLLLAITNYMFNIISEDLWFFSLFLNLTVYQPWIYSPFTSQDS